MKRTENKVVLASFAITDRGYPYQTPWRKIVVDAFTKCLANSGLTVDDIECGAVAYNERAVAEAALGTQVADALGLKAGVSMTPTSHACAGGGIAMFDVWHYVASGDYDVGLVITFQVGDSFDNMEAMNPIGNMSDYDYQMGFSHVEYSFLRDTIYREKYGWGDDVTPSAKWAWICHQNARKCKGSIEYGKDMPLWEDISAPTEAGERARNAGARGATATASILVSEKKAKELKIKDPVTTYISYAFRAPYIGNQINFAGDENYAKCDLAEQPGIMQAAKDCYAKAGITAKDIDVAEVHDLSGWEGIYSLEALGVCPIGKGGQFVLDGQTEIGGKCPACTHGGGIAYGHTSVGSDFQINLFEAALQLQGKAEGRQVEGAKVGVAQAYGTHHSYDVVCVVKKGEID